MDSLRHLMFAELSSATADIITDHGIPLVAQGGLQALTPGSIARRCNCSRQAVQQWCAGRPLLTIFAERFVARWVHWCDARTLGGRELAGLLPDGEEVICWTRVWLALVELAPRDPEVGALVRLALHKERRMLGDGIEGLSRQARLAGLRQLLCVEAALP